MFAQSQNVTRLSSRMIAVAALVVAAWLLAPAGAQAQSGDRSQPAVIASRSLTFETQFFGPDTDHVGLVWRGHTVGARGRGLTLIVMPLSSPTGSAERVWPVRVRWQLQSATGQPVLVAELEGVIDWKTNRMHVDGTVIEGAAKGRQVTLRATFRNLDPSGTLSVDLERDVVTQEDAPWHLASR
jgi:hypothetical protein